VPRGKRNVEVGVTSKSRDLDKDLRKNRKRFQAFGKKARRDLARSFSGVRRDLVGAIGVGLGSAGVVSAVRGLNEFETRMTRLGIQAGKSRQVMDGFRKTIDRLSLSSGISRDDLLGVSAQFVSMTGDFATAERALDVFARTAAASGASTEDLAGVAASLKTVFDVDADDFEKAFSILLASGKRGSVELRQMASLLGPIAAGYAEFGKTGVSALADMSAAFQVIQARFGFKPDQAATAFEGLFSAITKNAKKFKGVKIFERGQDGRKTLRPFADIVDDISNSRLAKDPTAIQKAFGRVEAYRTFKVLARNRDEWRNIEAATRDANDVSEDYAKFQQSAAGKTSKAWAEVKVALAAVFNAELLNVFATGLKVIGGVVKDIVDALKAAEDLIDRSQSRRIRRRQDTGGFLGAATSLGARSGSGGGLAAQVEAGVFTDVQRREADLVLREGRRLGVIRRDASIDPKKLDEISQISRRGQSDRGGASPRSIARAINAAQRIKGYPESKVESRVVVELDDDLRIKKKERRERTNWVER